jgi:hypothetical protein
MNSRGGSTVQIREGQDFLGGDQMPAAICLGKGNAHEKGQKRGCSGSTELASFLDDPGAKFLCGNWARFNTSKTH